MRIFIKASSTVVLSTHLTPSELDQLVYLHEKGEISVSISVFLKERVGFIPITDIDIERTMEESKVSPNQLPLEL
jgi:hypothetical protein